MDPSDHSIISVVKEGEKNDLLSVKGEDFWKRRENGKEISFESGRNVWTRRLLDEAVVVLRKTKLTTYLHVQVYVYNTQN